MKYSTLLITIFTLLFSPLTKADIKLQRTTEFLNDIFNTNNKFSNEHKPEFFQKFGNHQAPDTTYLGCSDSRVHLETIDQTPQNDIFAIRNIGNQISTSEGSIDYGVQVLNTQYLIIAGHSACGAVKAALAGKKVNIDGIDKELSTLKLSKTEINDAIIENVNNQVAVAIAKYQTKITNGELVILGIIYDFRNDFGAGYGKIILINENGETNITTLQKKYGSQVTHINFLK